MEIHQFHASVAPGDAITNGMFLIKEILTKLGFNSEIFAQHIPRELSGKVKHFSKYISKPENILLIHHSMGHDLDNWLKRLKEKTKILVFHNITPPHYFKDEFLRKYAEKGFEQLSLLSKLCSHCICDSEINKELLIRKYNWKEKQIQVIPLIFDFAKFCKLKVDKQIIEKFKNSLNILFVGRIARNKNQHKLIEVFSYFNKVHTNANLILVGSITDNFYFHELQKQIKELQLSNKVHFLGKVNDNTLLSTYKIADIFLCLSEHEGFGVPILEAFYHYIPTVALNYPGSNIKYTMAGGGVLLEKYEPKRIAALLSVIIKNRDLRREIITTQENALKKFEKQTIVKKFINFLQNISIDIDSDKASQLLNDISNEEKNCTRKLFQVEGPFDSSYSLALVNRETALALEKKQEGIVSLYSTEGPGDYEPNLNFLDEEIKKIWQRSEPMFRKVVLRNMYPPRLRDSKGFLNLMNSYGWEESLFPKEFMKVFNEKLDVLPVMSSFVKKILIDSGVKVPITITPLGVDHLDKVKEEPYPLNTENKFVFLHISSAFPRKGIDILLDAYFRAFNKDDKVLLIIKTFPNPHNKIDKLLKEKKTASAPEVKVINQDLSSGQILSLYKQAHCLVQPTRGEGFGLPMAEAMKLGIPVITTAYGGQSEFCNQDNAYLIDFEFKYAKTHMNIPTSVWIEPKKEHLAELMKQVYENYKYEPRRTIIKDKTEKARKHISAYTWEKVANKYLRIWNKRKEFPVILTKPKVVWVTTWNCKCGIATYSSYLLGEKKKDITIIANKLEKNLMISEDLERNTLRSWYSEPEKNPSRIIEPLLSTHPDIVHIQYNFGFFTPEVLGQVIDKLTENNIKVFLTLHSTKPVNKVLYKASLEEIKDSLLKAYRILVHSINDMNRLKEYGVYENVTLFPHGVFNVKELEVKKWNNQTRDKLKLNSKTPIIASFGFLLPNKGIKELIEAFSILKRDQLRHAKLMLLTALYPIKISEEYYKTCIKTIEKLKIPKQDIIWNTDFLEDREVLEKLSAADIVVFPYTKSSESASGAIRYPLSLKKKIICSDLEIFNDVREYVQVIPNANPNIIANAIIDTLNKEPNPRINRFLEYTNWDYLHERLFNMYEAAYKESIWKDML
jgi:glycosyltransferase involved in cell wall biosynthesis